MVDPPDNFIKSLNLKILTKISSLFSNCEINLYLKLFLFSLEIILMNFSGNNFQNSYFLLQKYAMLLTIHHFETDVCLNHAISETIHKNNYNQ